MDYMIFDSTGNALGAYDDALEAHAALREIASEHPEPTDVALIAYAGGLPVGAAMSVEELPAVSATVEPSPWLVDVASALAVAAKGANESFVAARPRTFSKVFGAGIRDVVPSDVEVAGAT